MNSGKKRFGRKVLAALAAVTLGLGSMHASADLTEDFNAGTTTPFVVTNNQTFVPGIQAGDATSDGGFLRVIQDNINGQFNTVAFDRTDVGAFGTTVIDFDFRFYDPPGGNPAADGMSLLLIPTSIYGASGPGAQGFTAEEPNVGGTFAIGLDIWNPSVQNDVSVHWNGTEVSNVTLDPNQIDLDNATVNVPTFHHARVEINQLNPLQSHVLFQVQSDIGEVNGPSGPVITAFDGLVGMTPYENRVQFAARTGGANMSGDVDNLNVSYSNPVTVAAPIDTLKIDFDTFGLTPATITKFNGAGFDPIIVPGQDGDALQLTQDGQGNTDNQIAADRVQNQSQAAGHRLMVDFAMITENGPGSAADGFGVAFLPTEVAGASGAFNIGSEEPNEGGGFGVGFDTHDNGGEGSNSISLHFGGAAVHSVDLGAPILENGLAYRATIDAVQVTGGSNVTVHLVDEDGTEYTPITDHFVAGLNIYDHRVAIDSRVGGLNSSTFIDNIMGVPLASADSPDATVQGFEGGDSNFQLRSFAGTPGPAIMNDGIDGNYLRLIHDGRGNNRNSLVFDMMPDGDVDEASGEVTIQGGFDFRMTSEGAPADGFSMMLIPVDTYGTEGTGAFDGDPFTAEEPNYAGVFGIAIDLYNGINELSVHWDGARVDGGVNESDNVDPLVLDFNNGAWNHLEFLLTEVEGGAELTIQLIDGSDFDEIFPIEGLFIPGLNIADYRVEFAGRTGGLFVNTDLDNINIATTLIPEPGTIAMMLMGLGMVAGRRRQA